MNINLIVDSVEIKSTRNKVDVYLYGADSEELLNALREDKGSEWIINYIENDK